MGKNKNQNDKKCSCSDDKFAERNLLQKLEQIIKYPSIERNIDISVSFGRAKPTVITCTIFLKKKEMANLIPTRTGIAIYDELLEKVTALMAKYRYEFHALGTICQSIVKTDLVHLNDIQTFITFEKSTGIDKGEALEQEKTQDVVRQVISCPSCGNLADLLGRCSSKNCIAGKSHYRLCEDCFERHRDSCHSDVSNFIEIEG